MRQKRTDRLVTNTLEFMLQNNESLASEEDCGILNAGEGIILESLALKRWK
jgi:hypothetical protein